MKHQRKLLAIAVVLIVLGLLIAFGDKAHADTPKLTKTFTGFAFEKSNLNLGMKKQISDWVKAHPDYGVASCVGYTGFNVKKRSQVFLQKLASARAQNICDYIHGLNGAISIYSTQGIPGDGKTAAARRVTVTLYQSGGSGGGTGVVNVGICDGSLKVSMQSRFISDRFLFSQMTIRDISTTCAGDLLDVYFIDKDGNQLASSTGNEITRTWLRLGYSLFTPTEIQSNQIVTVAFEIRKG